MWCGLFAGATLWSWCARSGVLRVLNSGSAALALPAWLPWLGVTSQARGQFGVTSGSNVLPNNAAGPRDWVRPVSWQQALPLPRTMGAAILVVIETAGLHSLFISFNSSVPISWPGQINLNNRNRGSVSVCHCQHTEQLKRMFPSHCFWLKTVSVPIRDHCVDKAGESWGSTSPLLSKRHRFKL